VSAHSKYTSTSVLCQTGSGGLDTRRGLVGLAVVDL